MEKYINLQGMEEDIWTAEFLQIKGIANNSFKFILTFSINNVENTSGTILYHSLRISDAWKLRKHFPTGTMLLL